MLASSFVRRIVLALVLGASLTSSVVTPARAQGRASDTGRITLDVVRADVRDVLRLLADVGGVNLVISDEVSGALTLKLKQVHWRDALSTVLRLQGLEMEERASIVLVASAARFERERAGQKSRYEHCLATAPMQRRILRLSHARAADVRAHVQAELSPRGRVSIDERTNSLIIYDVDCTP